MASDLARPVVFVVAAALLDAGGRVLLARRPQGKAMAGLWEFPGGKIGPGETPERALIRELDEELGIAVRPSDLERGPFVSHAYDGFHLVMLLYVVRRWSGEPRAIEHAALEWADCGAFRNYPMPEADIPLADDLKGYL